MLQYTYFSGSLSAENCVAPFGSSEDESKSIVRQSQKESKAAHMTQAVQGGLETVLTPEIDKGLVPRGGPKTWQLGK